MRGEEFEIVEELSVRYHLPINELDSYLFVCELKQKGLRKNNLGFTKYLNS